jgi:DNA mismatch repair protein MutS2
VSRTGDTTADVAAEFEPGDAVQTPLGKGVVREVRNGRRLLVEVSGRALEFAEADVSRLATPRRRAIPAQAAEGVPSRQPTRDVVTEVDLHGLTVEEALTRAETALNEAILGDVAQLRLIHGRSGGRIRAALHRRLREITSVRRVLLDPRNDGVTIVEL